MTNQKLLKFCQNTLAKDKLAYFEDRNLGLRISIDAKVNQAISSNDSDQFIYILDGVLDLKNNQTNTSSRFSPGDSFILPKGIMSFEQQALELKAIQINYKASPSNQDVISSDTTISNKTQNQGITYLNQHEEISWQSTSDGFSKKVLYQSEDKKFTSGIWQATPFSTKAISFPYHEFILVKKGSLVCIDNHDIEHEVSENQALFIPKGLTCTWCTESSIIIYFVQIK